MSLPCILIDSNKYLDLYSHEPISKLIDDLLALKDYILVTRQIRDEVARRRLKVIMDHLDKTWKEKPKPLQLPVHLLSLTEEQKEQIQSQVESTNKGFKNLQATAEREMARTLTEIAEGRDPITTQLRPLFDKAVEEEQPELDRARLRRELGNPPGKASNSLGDQITWEQFLQVVPLNNRVWIITGDGDYCCAVNRVWSLNPFLRDEIARASNGRCEVRCFPKLTAGLVDAAKTLRPNEPIKATDIEIQKSSESESDYWEYVQRIVGLLAKSPHSFDYLRNRGVALTDDEFRDLARICPQVLRPTYIIDRGQDGSVVGRRPGFHSVRIDVIPQDPFFESPPTSPSPTR